MVSLPALELPLPSHFFRGLNCPDMINQLSSAALRKAIKVKIRIEALEARLQRLLGSGPETRGRVKTTKPGRKRRMSASARAKMAAAARARWAKARAAGKNRL